MEEERISMSQRERERLKVLHEVEQGHLKQVEGAQRLKDPAKTASAQLPGRTGCLLGCCAR
jgi:hypothetical protein